MDILYLKSGRFSLHPVYGPVVVCKENHRASFRNPNDLKDIIATGWAKEVSEKKPEPEKTAEPVVTAPEEKTVEITPPWEQEDWNARSKTAKDKLQDYANELGLGLDLDLRRSVATLIKVIEAAQNDS